MRKLQKRNHLQTNNSGFTLVAVLMVLVVLTVLGLSILMITSNFVKITAGERDDQSVFYVAESGVVDKVYDINEVVKVAFQTVKTIYNNLPIIEKSTFDFVGRFYSEVVSKVDLSPRTMSSFESSFGNNPLASITVTLKSTNPPVFEIESVGTIGNKNRTVSQEVKVFLEPSLIEGPGISGNMALYVSKTIRLDGSVKIHGDAGTKSNNPGDVTFSGGGAVTGKVIQGVGNFVELPPFPRFPIYNIPKNQEIMNSNGNKTDLVKDGKLLIGNYITNGYTLNMSSNMEFKEILLNENNTLIINVGDTNREIVVDHLNMTNGHIKIIGAGKLTIYVKNKMTMGSGSTINSNTGDVEKLQVYQKGSSPINLSGSQKIFGSLFAESANINIGAGGGFHGNIISGGTEVKVDGGASVNTQLFLVPNAKFTLAGGGNIKGSIIADSFIGTGGGSVTYDVISPGIGSGSSIKDYGNGENLILKKQLIEK
ncbi:hypothetical protein FQ087_03245 [Sporosarcina sp. ANT_H38]|uniref:DUF7305 domain-containing protein n=1 Tax=Sporosarcina sp. ANT_H38 TaxID=2597358 RepID=UPI0011F33529|nr:PilX N-terminal domain-containing pilus assembly protein [Sporosarcina sp. ANT_H38]KAA0965337.1 hypothetical protein FQ087_03245 [Sporosarcina sp. ANT_H38]